MVFVDHVMESWNISSYMCMCIYSNNSFFSICLYDRYAHGTDDQFQECVCPVFKGLVITVSGLDSEERNIVKRTVETQGEITVSGLDSEERNIVKRTVETQGQVPVTGVTILEKRIAIYCDIFSLYCDILGYIAFIIFSVKSNFSIFVFILNLT